VVEQAGSIAGFAAILGLAVLSALYFSQARDLRRLREWAGRAPERAAEIASTTGQPVVAPVPGRVVAVPQRGPQAVQGPSTAAGAGAQGATQTPQPAGANGSPSPQVVKAGEEAKVAAGEDATAGTAPAQAADGDDGSAAKPAGAEGANAPDEPADGAEAGKPAPAKPGMPAPASAAAAAAGAGAASVAGPIASAPAAAPPAQGGSPAGASPPASPGQAGWPPGVPAGGAAAAGTRPGAPPQRPPGSVLPPRTGTLPPVRRLPSSNVGRPGLPQTDPFAPAPEQTRKRSRVYIVLAVAGVLILGAAAAIGVPKLVNGAKSSNSSPKTARTKKTKTTAAKAAPVKPAKITVAVLNGTGIPGLAAQIGDRVEADGFTKGTVSNAPPAGGQRANSVAMYAAGHQRDAQAVARKLRIKTVTPVDSESQSIAGDASVVVIVGSDKTQ
jgi:hypothetical protein